MGKLKDVQSFSIDSDEPVNVSFHQSSSIQFQTRMYWIEGQQGLETVLGVWSSFPLYTWSRRYNFDEVNRIEYN